jgi:AraC-like DNA-binding protein
MEVSRHDDGSVQWEMARATPAMPLQGVVQGYIGYSERSAAPLRRREVPSDQVPLIISFGPRIEVAGVKGNGRFGSFVAGLHDRHVITAYEGEQHGMEVNLTPLGAARLLGVSMDELTGWVVPLDDLIGPDGRRLAEMLAEAPGWAARFALLDRVLASRLSDAPVPPPVVARAVGRLSETHGALRIGSLAAELQCSRKHLFSLFRRHVGLPPKVLARILRFQRVLGALEHGDERWGDIAYECGFADQSHLNREFAALAGTTPTAFAGSRLPADGGWSAG